MLHQRISIRPQIHKNTKRHLNLTLATQRHTYTNIYTHMYNIYLCVCLCVCVLVMNKYSCLADSIHCMPLTPGCSPFGQLVYQPFCSPPSLLVRPPASAFTTCMAIDQNAASSETAVSRTNCHIFLRIQKFSEFFTKRNNNTTHCRPTER